MVTPYIVFHGNCNEAIELYQKIFDSPTPQILNYGEYLPEGSKMPPELLSKWIMHAEMKINETTFWFADEAVEPILTGNMTRLVIKVPETKTAKDVFDKLSVDGSVILPPTETFYSTFHASVIDKFGVYWNIVSEEAPNKS